MTRRSAALPILFFLWSSTASAVETLDQGHEVEPPKAVLARLRLTSGAIDHDGFVALLVDALLQLDGLDAQVGAKLEAGTLTPEEAELIFAETDAIRTTIAALATQ